MLSTKNKECISIILILAALFCWIGISSYEYDNDLYHGISIDERKDIQDTLQSYHIPATQDNILNEYKVRHSELTQE